jgi:choline-sulfatase
LAEVTPSNLVIVMADQFNARMLAHPGKDRPRTPAIDALAKAGTVFTNAYCNSPICVPSRAAFATGRYVHETGHWDNAHPYAGTPPGWGHALIGAGHEVVSIGKLHFRREGDPNGFSTEIMPMHVAGGVGDVAGSIRERGKGGGGGARLAREVGRGETDYARYDRDITAASVAWLRDKGGHPALKPWVLFVSFVCPHPPFIAPPRFYDLYDRGDLPPPSLRGPGERADHPFILGLLDANNADRHFTEETMRQAIAGYFGLCSFVDDNVGQIVSAIGAAGLGGNTRIVFTSDHGESLGRRGIWGKRSLYEESVAIPLVMAGPGIAAGETCATPVSLVDLHPTIVAAAGESDLRDASLPGRSLFDIASGADRDRVVLSEFHATGAIAAAFMVRQGQYKYVHYVGLAPQLFDLSADPDELRDLSANPQYASVRREMEGLLRAILDPEEVDRRARADQRALIERHGGVDAVLKRGSFGNSPVPGAKPKYASSNTSQPAH